MDSVYLRCYKEADNYGYPSNESNEIHGNYEMRNVMRNLDQFRETMFSSHTFFSSYSTSMINSCLGQTSNTSFFIFFF